LNGWDGVAGHNFKGEQPRTIQTKFALIWFISFRGEDLNAKAYDVGMTHNGLKIMGRVHMTRRANKVYCWFFYLFNNKSITQKIMKSKRYYKVYSRNHHGQLKENLFLPLFNTNFISKSDSITDLTTCGERHEIF
jgi:hypothetical protein